MVLSVFVAVNQLELSLTVHSMLEVTVKIDVPDAEFIDLDSGKTVRTGLTPLWLINTCCEVTPAPPTVISADRESRLIFSS